MCVCVTVLLEMDCPSRRHVWGDTWCRSKQRQHQQGVVSLSELGPVGAAATQLSAPCTSTDRVVRARKGAIRGLVRHRVVLQQQLAVTGVGRHGRQRGKVLLPPVRLALEVHVAASATLHAMPRRVFQGVREGGGRLQTDCASAAASRTHQPASELSQQKSWTTRASLSQNVGTAASRRAPTASCAGWWPGWGSVMFSGWASTTTAGAVALAGMWRPAGRRTAQAAQFASRGCGADAR